MRDTDVTTMDTAAPTLVEVSWAEIETACVLHGKHCWHFRLLTGIGPTHIVNGARCCCWCGLRQAAHPEDNPAEHGPLRPAPLSLLDVAIEAEATAW
jgi:hypothetical protein